VFENRVLRRIFGPKRDEVTGDWRKLHNEELHDLYSSPSIIRIIKSRRMRWAGHVVFSVPLPQTNSGLILCLGHYRQFRKGKVILVPKGLHGSGGTAPQFLT
jgi:hypothetical protein